MSSIIQTFQNRTTSLPVSKPTDSNDNGLRRRLSSLSLNLHPISSSPAAAWALQRSKSVQSMGEHAGNSIRKWWDWGWSWILSRKPMFAKDLELNHVETKGSWRHVFFKVGSEVKKIVRSSDRVGLPQTCKYDSFKYSNNFDDSTRVSYQVY